MGIHVMRAAGKNVYARGRGGADDVANVYINKTRKKRKLFVRKTTRVYDLQARSRTRTRTART